MVIKSEALIKKEQKNIIKMVQSLQKECQDISTGKEINKNFFKKFLDYSKEYNTQLLVANNQEIHMKTLGKYDIKEGFNHNDKMLYEIELARNLIKDIDKSLKEENKKSLLENSMGFMILLQQYIPNEQKVMLSLQNQQVDDKTKIEIMKKLKEALKSKKGKKDFSVLK